MFIYCLLLDIFCFGYICIKLNSMWKKILALRINISGDRYAYILSYRKERTADPGQIEVLLQLFHKIQMDKISSL